MKVAVPDYGCGNLASVARMVEKVGGSALIISSPSDYNRTDKVIIAGVGAFEEGMRQLRETGWAEVLNDAVICRQVPVLGICLGMQLMCKSSEEGRLPGFGWIDAEVRRFSFPSGSSLKIPHMGWNVVNAVKPNPLIPDDDYEERFYFVHSYHAVCNKPEDILATAHYGYEFPAAFSVGNIFGVQFHPEKSHRFGMALMKRFVELPC